MLIDGRSVEAETISTYGLCVIGAGAAGITLAREFVGSTTSVALVESGGFSFDPDIQQLYRGTNTGHRYFSLANARLRLFGGTTNHWEGTCRPLDPLVFQKRPWVPGSGWPLDRKDLDPYYPEAQRICELGPFTYDASDWARESNPDPLLHSPLISTRPSLYQYSPPTRFGEKYGDSLREAENIDIIHHSSVVDVVPVREGRRIDHVEVATLSGNRFRVQAVQFALCTGGIENARLLLASRSVRPKGVGNQNDLVGRYFFEHAYLDRAALLIPSDPDLRLPFFQRHGVDGTDVMGVLTFGPDVQREYEMLNTSVQIRGPVDAMASDVTFATGWQALQTLLESKVSPDPGMTDGLISRILADLDGALLGTIHMLEGSHSSRAFVLETRSEQAPDRESRVTLGRRKDALGVPRPQLHWRIGDQEWASIRRGLTLLGTEFGRLGIGRVRIPPDDEFWRSTVLGRWHHMGTTRMSRDPRRGVVDPDCRVHGLSNLYVGGSSVFATGGFSNPTLTIVALALRLARHLKRELNP